jgi:hypothetical protein
MSAQAQERLALAEALLRRTIEGLHIQPHLAREIREFLGMGLTDRPPPCATCPPGTHEAPSC